MSRKAKASVRTSAGLLAVMARIQRDGQRRIAPPQRRSDPRQKFKG